MNSPKRTETDQERDEIIFDAARQLTSPEQQAAYLTIACAQDAALRMRIEQMLKADAAAQEFFDTNNAPSLTVAARSEQETLVADAGLFERAGTLIDRYKLLQQIGEGGMGVVYMAEQEEPVRRRVALKIIKLGMDTKQVVARFEAERQALAMMDHPNIARVLDGGATETGRPYFVMELVQGVPITEFCDKNKLSAKDRLKLFIQVCQAIQSAHQKGIIHRDIKPSNVLVTLHHGDPMPKVIDFGIAKATNQKLTEKTLFTNYATMIGTPAYMSPEQAEMSSMDVDTRTDVYALGVLLYELLTGTTPFPEKRLRSLGYGEMQRVIMEEEPERPSTRLSTMANEQKTAVAKNRGEELRALSKLLKGDLDWVVMKCLEKDRTRRYDTANGVAADIQRHLSNEPVVARPPSAAYQFQKLVRRNKLAFTAAAAVVTALVFGIIASTWQATRAMRAERRAQGEARRALQAENVANEKSILAERQRHRAEAAELTSRRRAYAADMKAAQVAIEQNSRGQAARLLAAYVPKPGEEDQRGVEWRYLWRQARGDDVATWNLRDGLVAWVRCAPDGRHVLSATMGRKLKVHDSETGQVVRELDAICEEAGNLPSMSDDGRFLSYLTDGVLSVYEGPDWKLATRILVPKAKREDRATHHSPTCFSPDGRLLAVKLPTAIWILETATWKTQAADIFLESMAGATLTRLQFTRDGARLLVDFKELSGLRVYDLAQGQETSRVTPKMGLFLRLDATDRLLVEVERGSLTSLTLRRFDDFEPIWTKTNLHSAWIAGCAFSKDGQMLATASGDQSIALLRVRDGELMARLGGHQNEVWGVDPSPDGQFFFSASKDGTIKKWRWTPPSNLSSSLAAEEEVIPSIGINKRLLTFDRARKFFSTWSGVERTSWPVHPALAATLDLARTNSELAYHFDDAKRLVAFTNNDRLTVYRTKDGATEREITLGLGRTNPWVISPDLHWLAVILPNNESRSVQTVQIWDLTTTQMVREHRAVSGFSPTFSRQVAFSPDSRLLAFPNETYEIVLWNLSDQHEERRMNGPVWHLMQLCFSADGKLLAAGGWEGVVYLWEVSGGQLAVPPMHGHGGGVGHVSFARDGRTLVTSGGTVRFWSTATGSEMLRFNNGFTSNLHALLEEDSLLQLPDSTGSWRTRFERIPTFAEIEAAEKTKPLEQ